MPILLRPLLPEERELLRIATLANLNWAGPQRFTFAQLDADPQLLHYLDLRPERGDFGFVAEFGGLVVGVVWLLLLDSTDPGYGFVADGVPELSLCVWSGYRGRGVGRALLDRALTETSDRGLRRVGLSVESGNPAVRLYRTAGFVPVAAADPVADPGGTMVVELPVTG